MRTVAATRSASVDELAATTRPRLAAALAQGTTTCEVKSGYGLETDAELRMLRAVRVLATSQPVELSPTFMGAHEVPVEYRGRRDDYLRLVVDEMLPAVAAEGLAEWNDVFCEDGVFTPAESRRVLEAGRRHGLSPRIHADELGASGGSRVAAEVGAISADHLIYTGEAEADAMARGRRHRHLAAGGSVLPEARPLCAGPDVRRARRSGGAGHRHESGRRTSRRRCRS